MTRPGYSWKQVKPQGPFDAIVIGSGIGGLTCASLLAKYGRKRVLVLEQHYRIGGYTHTFSRPGYEWDVGVHYVGQVGERGSFRGAFDRLTDGRLQWGPMPDVYDRIELAGRGYDFVTGAQRFIERLTASFPKQGDALTRYVKLVKATSRQSGAHHLSRGLPRPLTALTRPFFSWPFLAKARRTTAEVLAELTQDEELRAVLAGQYGDYGLPPGKSSWGMHAVLVTHYLEGGFYPVGGAAAFAQAFAPVIEAAGGHLATGARVAQVVLERGRAVGVRLDDQTEVRAPLIISDAGLVNTLGLLPDEARPASWAQPVAKVSRSVSHFSLYLGLAHTDQALGLVGTNLWLHHDERHDQNAARYAADPSAPFPWVYVTFPSAKDPDWASRFPGRATIDVVTPASIEWYSQWKGSKWHQRGAAYDAAKAELTARLLEQVYARLPQLRGKVDVVEASTPLSTARFSGHSGGEPYGLDHTPARYELPLHARTPIEGLLITGADLSTCGVAGALVGGVTTASAIVGPHLIPLVMRAASPRSTTAGPLG